MRFERLRLCGFKSFVEPVEIEIKPGLSGVVGPNGCGKSNLVEGLRWLMGANSAKAMRASGMDEVIFAGTTGGRPARSWAEVTLEIDNSDRRAPAQFNDQETLSVSRRVVRRAEGSVSTYTINGKEVRARDVQILFADASTGATSPALVRQGQISELINAKPTERRRFLEEAAGVTGLAARRHEAQLRLKAAADNLERLDDVIGELDVQNDQLARQARKASKYRELSEEIKTVSRKLALSRVREAHGQHAALEKRISEKRSAVAEAVEKAARTDRLVTDGHETLENLRASEREAATAMTEAEAALKSFENEIELRQRAAEERERTLERLGRDEARENDLLKEASETIAASEERIGHLKSAIAEEGEAKGQLEAASEQAEAAAQEAERLFEEAQRRAAEVAAEARAAKQARSEAESRLATAKADHARIEDKLRALPRLDQQAVDEAAAEAARTSRALEAAETAQRERNEALAAARKAHDEAQAAFRAAKEEVTLLDKEASVIAPLIKAIRQTADQEGSLLETLNTPEDMRAGLAAALGQALHAVVAEDADHAWTELGRDSDGLPALPDGAEPLSGQLGAPGQLSRRLASIGLVEGHPSEAQLYALKPGQSLVNRKGQLWRWDGYRRLSESDSNLEELLAASSRLREIEAEQDAAAARRAETELAAEVARRELQAAETALGEARQALTAATRDERHAAQHAERTARDAEAIRARREGLEEQLQSSSVTLASARQRLDDLGHLADRTPVLDEDALGKARAARDEARRRAGQARGQAAEYRRNAVQRRDNLRREEGQVTAWRERRRAAEERLRDVAEQREALQTEIDQTTEDGNEDERGQELELEAYEAKARWERVRGALSEAEKAQTDADRARREAEAAAAAAREALAEVSAEGRAAREKLDAVLGEARMTLEEAEGHLAETEANPMESVERLSLSLTKLERERDRLGAVNLLAAEEQETVSERLETLRRERTDCEAAANQLKTAVNAINREGRQRLLAAFDAVNGHFRDLFTSLFGGGEAQLKFVDNDDPLAAGLEIFACPPGKKLQSLSLMSGGEQALTATALIFAAFKTNPAPICVLDEVDAPLDDANVERFCDLLSLMANASSTRFIVVTHHPLTMSRMDRLFGVTMMERGVSRLFSIDLESARRLAA